MFKDIKFRARRTDSEKPDTWAYGDLIHTIKITKDKDIPVIRVGGCDIDEDTIQQYIGLDDKDGKEIYEGDIVDVYDLNQDDEDEHIFNGVVYWDYDYQCLAVKLIGYNDWNMLSAYDNTKMRVIGNIYDNPEMLTEEERHML